MVYAEPLIYAGCLMYLQEGTEVVVDTDLSKDIFYEVCTVSGIEGYCLTHQIKLEEAEDGREHT